MIPFKNLAMKCGVPLLVAKMSSINDAHSLRILASLITLKNIILDLAIAGALQYKSVFHPQRHLRSVLTISSHLPFSIGK